MDQVLLRKDGFSFNSRTREGCDLTLAQADKVRTVSIHAPARGAMRLITETLLLCGFNSRTREGCDVVTPRPLLSSLFQFTHPRGVR